MLALDVHRSMILRHVDITAEFLHERYAGAAPLFIEHIPEFIWRRASRTMVLQVLLKIYGTRKAPLFYADGLAAHQHALGYQQCASDSNVYTRTIRGERVIFEVTVDEFCVAADTHRAFRRVLAYLRTKYQAKDLGSVRRLLRWSVPPIGRSGVHLSQPYLARRFVQLVDPHGQQTARSPYIYRLDLSPGRYHERQLSRMRLRYSSAVGMLRYLVDSTRPYLAFITSALATATAAPNERH